MIRTAAAAHRSRAFAVSTNHFLARSALFVILSGIVGCVADGSPTAPDRLAVGGRPSADATINSALQSLWIQNTNKYATVSVGTEAGMEHVLDADDFVVPANTIWSLSRVVFTGFRGLGPNPPEPLFVSIRQDLNGAPGGEIASYYITPTVTAYQVGYLTQYDYAYDLPSPVQLSAGTYWVVGECGIYYFECGLVDAVTGHEALIGNWNTGTSVWHPIGIFNADDLAFALYGTALTPTSATTDLEGTVNGLGLASGTQASLDAKLDAVLAAIAGGNTALACQLLDAFMNEVRAQTGKSLTQSQADALLSQAAQVKTLLGC